MRPACRYGVTTRKIVGQRRGRSASRAATSSAESAARRTSRPRPGASRTPTPPASWSPWATSQSNQEPSVRSWRWSHQRSASREREVDRPQNGEGDHRDDHSRADRPQARCSARSSGARLVSTSERDDLGDAARAATSAAHEPLVPTRPGASSEALKYLCGSSPTGGDRRGPSSAAAGTRRSIQTPPQRARLSLRPPGGPLASRRRLRHPRELTRARGRPRGDRRRPAGRALVPRRPRRLRAAPERGGRRSSASGRSSCLVGNHDLGVLGRLDLEEFSPDAAAVVATWTRTVLLDENRAYLERLEPQAKVDRAELFHASPRDPVWEYVVSEETAAGRVRADRLAARARRPQPCRSLDLARRTAS